MCPWCLVRDSWLFQRNETHTKLSRRRIRAINKMEWGSGFQTLLLYRSFDMNIRKSEIVISVVRFYNYKQGCLKLVHFFQINNFQIFQNLQNHWNGEQQTWHWKIGMFFFLCWKDLIFENYKFDGMYDMYGIWH